MSEPPHASSWAAPPEFYLDENLAGKTLRRFLQDRGYTVHTPAELFGTRAVSEGVPDGTWLKLVGERHWIVFGRDTRILERASELDAYRRAKVHMFLFPGNATREELIAIAAATLAIICTKAAEAKPMVWRVRGGTRPHVEPTAPRRGRRRP
ncbi:MAG: hypothetical protein ACRDTV_16795 [Mycobacterium sp.]